MSNSVPVHLNPVPGFCVKSTVVQPAVFKSDYVTPQNVREQPPALVPITVGFKTFVNIAYDPNVPPPPPGSEQAIQDAMKGQDIDVTNPDGWYVPVIISQGRLDKDKAGKPSLVFDCIYNPSVKLRTLADHSFKLFLIELAFQRIEAQTSLVLSREISTPNIASKGKLEPRTVSIPASLLPTSSASSSSSPPQRKPIIEEVASRSSPALSQPSATKPKLKGILKSSASQPHPIDASLRQSSSIQELTWSWSKVGEILRIVVSVPPLSRAEIERSMLDVEPRRLILTIPSYPVLDVNLSLSDAEIVARASASGQTSGSLAPSIDGAGADGPSNILTLKRQRDFDVDNVTSEWHVDRGVLVIDA